MYVQQTPHIFVPHQLRESAFLSARYFIAAFSQFGLYEREIERRINFCFRRPCNPLFPRAQTVSAQRQTTLACPHLQRRNMVLEYSGRHLALIELSASLKLLLYLSLLACLFVPWGLAAPGASAIALLTGALAYTGKLAVGGILLALFETSIAKMRVFRVPEFLGAALMLGLLATLLLFVSRSL